eukprot:226093-Amphidinium_carterae.1
MREIKTKWKTLPQDACPEPTAPLPQITSARIVSLERLHKASQRLKSGTAYDAFGWCTESMHQILQANAVSGYRPSEHCIDYSAEQERDRWYSPH